QNIPIKDAVILSNCPLREVRRVWIHRILDHDGVISQAVESVVLSGERSQDALRTVPATATGSENEGGIEAWLRLGEACGLSRDGARAPVQMRCALVHARCDPSRVRSFLNANSHDRWLCPAKTHPRSPVAIRLENWKQRSTFSGRRPRIKRDRSGNSYPLRWTHSER